MRKETLKEIYLAGGCFWGTEHFFKQVDGVEDTETGYANSLVDNPNYEQVCAEKTNAAETVRVVYNPKIVSLQFLLSLYFMSIDPMSYNQQGLDRGTQYRTGIYYTDDADLDAIRQVYDAEQKKHTQPIAVELKRLKNFFPAEDYHQDYLTKKPNGYCHLPRRLFEFARQAKCPSCDTGKLKS